MGSGASIGGGGGGVGVLVNCSSLGGLVGGAGRGAYHASKHGVIGLTKSVALDDAARGVRINAACPGVIATAMYDDLATNRPDTLAEVLRNQPTGRVGHPDEIAATVWLSSLAASFVIGAALPVDGGFTAQ